MPPRLNRILFVFEFPPSEAEWQLRDLAAGLQARRPGLAISYCTGFAARYSPGGLHPLRIVNGFWVHLRAIGQILLGRYDAVLVRSAPPLIQMTVALACRLRGLPYWIWLMDAHPEIEQVLCQGKPVIAWVLGALCRLNRRGLRRAQLVVVLDQAMRRRLVPSVGADRVIVCPTWGREGLAKIKVPEQIETGEGSALRLVYLGNFGLAHDLPLLCRLLEACAARRKVELVFIGTAARSIEPFKGFAAQHGIAVSLRPHVAFSELPAFLPAMKFDYGIVTLNERFLGLLSPSKFIGYLAGGLPVIYLGPADTNAALVCDELGAGLRIGAGSFDSALGRDAIERIFNRESRRQMTQRVPNALAHFDRYNGEYLAGEIAKCTGLAN